MGFGGGVCTADECDTPRYARGLCRSHYERDLKVRNPEYAARQRDNVRRWAALNPERKRRSDQATARRCSPEARRNRALRSKYGITLADYEALLAEQGGRCALCREVSPRRLHVDHCHQTGRVRGLLCSRCNVALGWFRDDATWALRAAAYLASV